MTRGDSRLVLFGRALAFPPPPECTPPDSSPAFPVTPVAPPKLRLGNLPMKGPLRKDAAVGPAGPAGAAAHCGPLREQETRAHPNPRGQGESHEADRIPARDRQ